jgi:hypothetical protein
MHKQLAAGIAAFCLLAGSTMAAQPGEQLEVLDTALVVGDQPGPGLWKVTRGDNVLWLLGSTRFVPARATWRAEQVKARIAESQQVLYPPVVNVYPSIGVLRIVSLLPYAIGIDKIPDNGTLQKVLQPEVHARWRTLRDKYFTRSQFVTEEFLKELEEQRPGLVAMQLRGFALSKNGLSTGYVDLLVRNAAKEKMVPIHRPPTLSRAVKVESPGRLIREARKKVQQPELDCFTRTLDKVESDVEGAKVRANAWARGDIAQLRELPPAFQRSNEDCFYSMLAGYTEQNSRNALKARKILADFDWHEEQGQAQALRDWVVAARAALEKNSSTFAVLPIEDLLRADGPLAALRAQGYTVEEPL